MLKRNIPAVIWDYDGTLVDTRHRNLNITRKIIEKIAGIRQTRFPALESLENYVSANKKTTNWRELYHHEFGLNEDQIDRAGSLWTEYQLNDNTPVPFFDDIPEVIRSLRNFPHGIVSQNSKSSIKYQLKVKKLLNYFGCIIRYEEVSLKKQKPAPDGLLLCIEKLTELTSGYIVYIGDHETDVQCAINANQQLTVNGSKLKVVTIGAFYCTGTNDSNWPSKPDYKTNNTKDIIKIIQGLS